MEYWYLYIFIGLVCGVFSATFGVGSGILMIPALVLLISNMEQKPAQGICLAAMVLIALAGAIRYKMTPGLDINLPAVGLVAIGGVVGAVFGTMIAANLSGPTLRRLFAIVMIIAAVRMLVMKSPQPKPDDQAPTKNAQTSPSEPGRPEVEVGHPDSP